LSIIITLFSRIDNNNVSVFGPACIAQRLIFAAAAAAAAAPKVGERSIHRYQREVDCSRHISSQKYTSSKTRVLAMGTAGRLTRQGGSGRVGQAEVG
jgi:hypothetical protein